MTDRAVCYVADMNFMLPTLISAMQVRRYIPTDKARIYITTITDDEARIEPVRNFVRNFEIELIPVAEGIFAGIDWASAYKTHVPVGTLGRLFLAEILPRSCRHILYLDGDTWIKDDPSALVEATIPEGRIAAAEDRLMFCQRERAAFGQFVRDYFRGLGIDAENGYFNAGVLAASRTTWATLAAEALQFFRNNIERCKFNDQSALNVVAGGRRLPLSLAWNFQSACRYLNIEHEIRPKIYHFAEAEKPWTGPVEPWADLFPLYQQKIAALSPLALPQRHLSQAQLSAANGHVRRMRRKLRYVYPWRLWARRAMVRRHSGEGLLPTDF